MEDMGFSLFEKHPEPVDHLEFEFDDGMIKLELEQDENHHDWTVQLAFDNHKYDSQLDFLSLGKELKLCKIQCVLCKKWFLNDSIATHLKMHCNDNICELCQEIFKDDSSLCNHLLTHMGVGLLECSVCLEKFAHNSLLHDHMQTHMKESSDDLSHAAIKKCSVDATSILKCNESKSSSDKEEPSTCQMSQTAYSSMQNLEHHMLTHSCGDSHQCETSNASFEDRSKLNSHKMIHHDNTCAQKSAPESHTSQVESEKPYNCETCGRSYKRKSDLLRHLMIHNDVRPYECPECHKLFRENSKLNSHMTVHTGEKKYECQLCQKMYARKSDLTGHMLIHTGGSFDCKTCKKIFTRKSDLKRHTLIHTGEKPYVCVTCNMAFRERTRLNSHMTEHTSDLRYKCHICSEGFPQKGILNKHMLSHTKRTFACHFCQKSFAKESTLNSHLLQLHNT
ncbi:hypothetical protein QAD02_019494 [Eretmocerus hayati]|uniref:Uncharacterized protein n=1 Tax=Eretmocerus hayati TaxID=131215 RepID=A0ACC2PJQ9_9HYME|nr:hypothetical protein QAD02_019494 [Eretmocerus hayati]